MTNESPKNESAAPAQTKQGSKFQASLDEHGFKLLVIFFIVFAVLCLTPTFLVFVDFYKDGVLNEQYQTIFFTTLITLFGILITGIFLFMTFRIEHGAKIEAREEAREEARDVAKGVAEERVKVFVLKAEQDIDVFRNQAIESLKQTEAVAAKKIQSLDAQLRDQTIESLKQVKAAAEKEVQAFKDQAMEETGKAAELIEEAAKKVKNAGKGSPRQSGSAG